MKATLAVKITRKTSYTQLGALSTGQCILLLAFKITAPSKLRVSKLEI